MSFWYGDLSQERPRSRAEGKSTFGEVAGAALESLRLVDNTTARAEALTRAYDDRIRAVQAATGEKRDNPMSLPPIPETAPRIDPLRGVISDTERQRLRLQEATEGFNSWLADVSRRHPDQTAAIRADVPVERDAEGLARHAEERVAKAMAANDGISKYGALLIGGMAGSLYDPIQVMTLFAGGGAGGARTAIGRIAQVAMREAAVNGLVEAGMQPQVQAWRKQAGLPSGWDEAMQNVGFAALAGSVLGGGIAGIGEAASRVFKGRDLDRAAEEIAKTPALRPEVADALKGDAGKAVEALRPLRETLPAEVRGALDHGELIARDTALRPAAATEPHHDRMTDRATRAALDNRIFEPEADPEQVARIVARIAPAAEVAAPAERTLQQFLAAGGGVRDFKGELDALGLTNASERFIGRLVKPDGMPLDQARLAAAEAGYFNHRYGTTEEAMARSTVNDLLDELDVAARGQAQARGGDSGQAYAESLVTDIVARAGPAVDDELIVRAAELANSENLDPADALDRVLMEADRQEWEAEAAAAPRPAASAPLRGGLDDPATLDEDALFTAADLDDLPDDFDIPFFDDGRTLRGEELMAEIDHHEHLFQVVEACRA